ncbi:MAG: oxidase, partial [Methylobacterium brachiatum]|nr:oxidase [Methylobacterium brachiatum]
MADLDRRRVLQGGLGALAAAAAPVRARAEEVTLPFGNGTRPLVAYPGKRPLLQNT